MINDQPEQAIIYDSGSESGDEETPALMRKNASEQRAKRFTANHDPSLIVAGSGLELLTLHWQTRLGTAD
jgi:hypothetical protein